MSIFGKLFGKAKGDNKTSTSPAEHNNEVSAPGWDAIDAALKPLYGDQQAKHYGTAIPASLGGKDPLQGISAYARETPVRHWHYVTYGFSELYKKESSDPSFSGYGFELTFRLRVDSFEDEPPVWAMNFLQNLARYVFGSGNVFEAGHYMNGNGPIASDVDTPIRAIAFVEDPELPPMDTPNGRVQFLQVVGLTEDEELALKQWSTLKALDVFLPHLPLFTTSLARTSLLNIASVREQLQDGANRDGSNSGMLFVDQLGCQHDANGTRIILGARQVEQVIAILPYRLRFGKHYALLGDDTRFSLLPGDTCSVTQEDGALKITITLELMDELCRTLKPVKGEYRNSIWQDFIVEVRPTYIRDQQGNIEATIGE